MPSFGQLFIQSKGKPIVWAGKELHLMDRLPVTDGTCFEIVLESVNSPRPQAVILRYDGELMVGGVEYVRGFVIWYDSDPKVTRIQVTKAVSGYVGLKNGWKSGSVALDSGHNGAAMQIDHLPNGGRRYRCNDGHPDDNFDDIVFRVDYVVEQST